MSPFRLHASTAFLALMCLTPVSALAQDSYSGSPTNAYAAAATSMETRLTAVEDQMRGLTGKVEQIEFVLRRMDQAIQRMQADSDARLTKLENAAQAAAAAPAVHPQTQAASPAAMNEERAEDQAAPVAGTLGDMKVRGDKVVGAVKNPKTPPLPDTPADYGLTAQEQYDRAFDLLRQANYDDAEKAFKSFIDKNPKDKLTDNAKYWYAETFYVRAKFGDAAIAFAEAYEQNPKGSKAPDALLKLAMSLGAVNKTQDACNTLSALKTKYPKASSSIRARADQEKARLKCK